MEFMFERVESSKWLAGERLLVRMSVRETKLCDWNKKPQTVSLIFANADEFETLFVERVHAGLSTH
jgi:hypothetical protein